MNSVQKTAARWFARMHSAAPDHPDRARFEAWLAADHANETAYAAFVRLWGRLDADAAGIHSLAASMEGRQKLLEYKRRRYLQGGLLAVALLGCMGSLLFYQWRERPQFQLGRHSETAQILTLSLPDGTKLTMGGDSEIQIDYSRAERHVLLIRGDAIFNVTHDPARPFVVDSGALRTTVLGTRFVVTRLSDRIRVSVDHGTVKLATGRFWKHKELILHDGQSGELSMEGSANKLTLAWLNRPATDGFAFEQGSIIFNSANLAEIAETLSRYRQKPIMVTPGPFPSPRITAVVQLTDVAGFLATLPKVSPVIVRDEDRRTTLSTGAP